MEGQTTGAGPGAGPGPGSPASGSGPPGPRPNPPSGASDSTLRRLWWLWVLIGVVAVFLIAFFIGRATNQETVAETTTTTTTPAVYLGQGSYDGHHGAAERRDRRRRDGVGGARATHRQPR